MSAQTVLSDSAIRARSNGYCSCRQECGHRHPQTRCKRGWTRATSAHLYNDEPMVIMDNRLYCARCARRITAKRARQ